MQDGHFFFTLPPGKYGLNHFQYFGKIGHQSFDNDGIGILLFYTSISDKRLVFFDVLPNQANYIGTIKAEMTCCYYRECMTGEKPVSSFDFVPIDINDLENKPFSKNFCSSPTLRVDDISVSDENEQAFSVFQRQYQEHPMPIKSLANSDIKQSVKPSDKGYIYFETSEILKKYKPASATFGEAMRY